MIPIPFLIPFALSAAALWYVYTKAWRIVPPAPVRTLDEARVAAGLGFAVEVKPEFASLDDARLACGLTVEES